jgi:cytochrome c
MPRTEGVDIVIAQCSYCHSPFLIMQQRLSRERWDSIIRLMVEERGMPEPDPADRQVILDYLARYFSGAPVAGGQARQ